MRIPILTYHSMNVTGPDYVDNDLRALHDDLRNITESGFRVWPLHRVVSTWLREPDALEGRRIVALTADDGPDSDFRDLPHPEAGPQRSILNVLSDFQAEFPGAQPDLNLTSFVVVSPEARRELDRKCLVGRGWWNDDWWPRAAATGLMDIANHSWDHHHDELPRSFELGVERGTFTTIDTRELADHEIRRAAQFLRAKAPNRGTELFAYPYGESNDYLVERYLPENAADIAIVAAFTAEGGFLTRASNRWTIPRCVFGQDWRSPRGLDGLLYQAQTG